MARSIVMAADDEGEDLVIVSASQRSAIELSDDDDSISDTPSTSTVDETTDEANSVIDAQGTPRPPWALEDLLETVRGGTHMSIRPGESIELLANSEIPMIAHGDFLRVQHILRNVATDEIVLQGWLFRRNHKFNGMLPNKLNECCMVVSRVGNHRGCNTILKDFISISSRQVLRKRHLVITNARFPKHSYRERTFFSSDGANADEVRRSIESSSELVARWVYIAEYANAEMERRCKPLECVLREFKDFELQLIPTKRSQINPSRITKKVLQEWLGKLPSGPTLTFADAFSGAGGMSQGAHKAGLIGKWACDSDSNACDTYRLNLPLVDVWNMEVQDLLVLLDDLRVDVLHLSPPCQPFSAANSLVRYRHHESHAGRNDEANQAALFCVTSLLHKVRPRVVTVEETSGLITHHREYFPSLVSGFTEVGYSVRWTLMNFAEFGLCQPRKRIMIVASCPGGFLPEFPKPTHGGGLLPYITIYDRINNVTDDAEDHIPIETLNKFPYNAHTQLKGLIATGGTTAYHPSGRRRFTVRELTVMQGFDMDFMFPRTLTQTEKIKQAGNAVPPSIAKQIYESILLALREENAIFDSLDED